MEIRLNVHFTDHHLKLLPKTVCYKAKHSVLQGKKRMDQCIKKKPTKCGFTSWGFFVCKYGLSLVYDSWIVVNLSIK